MIALSITGWSTVKPIELALAAAVTCSSLVRAQHEGLSPREDPPQLTAKELAQSKNPAWVRGAGLGRVDGELWAAGPGYKAHFRSGSVEITPPLGQDAPRSLPLVFALESIDVGATRVLTASGGVEPVQDGQVARYEHGHGIVERYEARVDGLEQSFVLDARPEGSGDLVVRGRASTELVPEPKGAGLFFRALGLDGDRGLEYGGVTGIDANGWRVSGSVAWLGDAIELRLPAAFVATAAFPLTVDPKIGGTFSVASGFNQSYADPDVAYDLATANYLVVFERVWSATDFDVYAQRVFHDGSLAGSQILLETSIFNLALNPTVCICTLTGTFLVVWQQSANLSGPFDLVCKSTSASTGTQSAPALVHAAASGSAVDPRAGGSKGDNTDVVLVCWVQTSGTPGIRYTSVRVPASGDPGAIFEYWLTSDGADSRPVITKAAGTYHLIAWPRFFNTPAPGDHDLYFAIVKVGGALEVAPTFLVGTIGPDEIDLEVDGNEVEFLAVYRSATSSTSASYDIHGRRVTYIGSTTTVGSTQVFEGDSLNEFDPAVTFTGDTYIVGWSSALSSGLGSVLRLIGVRPGDCAVCENAYSISAGLFNHGLELCSQKIEDGAPNGALAVWETVPIGFGNGSISAQRLYGFTGGAVADLGGGCSGGIAGTDCPAKPNSHFTHTLSASLVFGPTFLLLSFERIDVSCGFCTIVPNPFTGFVFPAGSSSPIGANSLTTDIPNDPSLSGVTFYEQWATLSDAFGCTPMGAALSNALQVTLQ